MRTLFSRVRAVLRSLRSSAAKLWTRFRGLPRWLQVVITLAVLALAGGLVMLLTGGKDADSASQVPTVTVASVAELSGSASSGSAIGTVRSVTEAEVLAQAGGTVRAVHAAVGARVGAGAVLAELDNASERAQVLQAEGAYDAAVAARSSVSPTDANATVRNAYRSAFTAIDTAVETQVDTFFGEPTAVGPRLLINPGPTEPGDLSRERTAIKTLMNEWRENQPAVNAADPAELLADAESRLAKLNTFLTTLSTAANARDSRVTSTQLTALASARATVNAQQAAIAAAREAYRGKSVSSTASVDASVKQALGVLRGAQAQLEKTIIRAPIAGQVNFLPIRVGDYVTSFTHVATVAQNGALEIVTYVSEEDRTLLAAGMKVGIGDGDASGVVTLIAPALDPVTKQIEVHVAADSASGLTNGQSVRIALPDAAPSAAAADGPVMLPLAAVKLRADERIVFSVGENGRLVAHAVTIGDVRGDRIEITSPLDPGLRIVADARGLADGQLVKVGE